jgi:rhodanese-related sulfurtransferase
MPSRISDTGDRDGIPNVVLEAMAAGLPVVATDVSGIPEAVLHGETGLLVKPDVPNALADALEQIVTNPRLAAELGGSGTTRVRAVRHRGILPSLAAAFGVSLQADSPHGRSTCENQAMSISWPRIAGEADLRRPSSKPCWNRASRSNWSMSAPRPKRAIASIEGSRLLDRHTATTSWVLDRDRTLVFQCHHGIRSQAAADYCVEKGSETSTTL